MKRDQQLECFVCSGSSEGLLLLHIVRYRGAYHRLCSNCVLKTHQGLFCPICLQVYDTSTPPPHARLMCVKCPSICHLSCASSPNSSSSSSSSYVCPPCSNPNFAFFSVSNNKKVKVNGNDGVNGDNKRMVDVASAKALVAAAKFAALSMSKAAAVARVEAEKRVKEAALAKKRAREALERLLYLAAEEKKGKSMRPPIAGLDATTNNGGGGGKNSNGLYPQRQETNHGRGK